VAVVKKAGIGITITFIVAFAISYLTGLGRGQYFFVNLMRSL